VNWHLEGEAIKKETRVWFDGNAACIKRPLEEQVSGVESLTCVLMRPLFVIAGNKER
jgi:hypothetical protein